LYKSILYDVSDGIATITLNRPEARNALSPEMRVDLNNAFAEIKDRAGGDIKSLIICGAGGAFCAGGDVKAMAEGKEFADDSLEAKAQALRGAMEISRLLHEMPKPTIAMVGGAAAGAGLSLALACDLRIAGTEAKFTTAFARVGYSGDFGGSYFLSQLVGTAKARELYFTADLIDAPTALALGMVNRVVADDALADAGRELAERLAKGPSIALGYMKRNLNAADNSALSQVMDLEAEHMVRTMMTEDHARAAQAFVEKRAPVFEGS